MEYYIVKKGELMHHGILGMKWGVRRWQNEDGSWTPAGRERYGSAKSRYQAAKENYRIAKKSKDPNSISTAKIDLKESKKEVKESAKQLQKDMDADYGRYLFKKGKDDNASIAARAIGRIALGAVATTVIAAGAGAVAGIAANSMGISVNADSIARIVAGVSTLSIFAGTAHQVANRNSGMNKEIRAINEYRERLDAKKKHYLPAKAATVAAGVWAVKKQTRHSNKSKSSNKSKAAYFKNN